MNLGADKLCAKRRIRLAAANQTMSTEEKNEPMSEEDLVIDILEEYHRARMNMMTKMESLPVARLTPRLRGELTEDEIEILDEFCYPVRSSKIIKTGDRTKHNLFNQVIQEMKDRMRPYHENCKLKDDPMVNLGFILYTNESEDQMVEVDEPEYINNLFDSYLATVVNIHTAEMSLLRGDFGKLIEPLVVVVNKYETREDGIHGGRRSTPP